MIVRQTDQLQGVPTIMLVLFVVLVNIIVVKSGIGSWDSIRNGCGDETMLQRGVTHADLAVKTRHLREKSLLRRIQCLTRAGASDASSWHNSWKKQLAQQLEKESHAKKLKHAAQIKDERRYIQSQE